ncbi:hypothetical protein DF047_31820 [Burkholderia cenocepacia]|nr:hypothetical protein DF047_31820 [Burkholderia cenocepacia]
MTRRRCDRVFQWSRGRYRHAGRCGCTTCIRHAGACVTEREAGMRADRIGAAACADSLAAHGVCRDGEAATAAGLRSAAYERDDGARRGARTSRWRTGARHTRDSHVSPTQKDSACQRPCPTIL